MLPLSFYNSLFRHDDVRDVVFQIKPLVLKGDDVSCTEDNKDRSGDVLHKYVDDPIWF